MTVLIEWRRKYLGLSTDTKPTDAENGSLYLEANTDQIFIFLNGTWHSVDQEY